FVVSLLAGTGAAVHAAMTKQDVRAAIGWVAVTLFSPLFGALLYFVAGVNRIRHTRVSQQRDETPHSYATYPQVPIKDVVPASDRQFASLRILGDTISNFPVVGDNSITPLAGGDE